MTKMTMTVFIVYLISLLAVVTANPALYSYGFTCVTQTLISPQIGLGPTRTVFVSTETTTSSLDCHGCSLVLRTAFPLPDILPSQTTVTEGCTTATSYVCASPDGGPISTTALPTPAAGLHRRASLDDQKRDVALPPFGGEAQQLVIQLATAIYIVKVINNGGPLQDVCDSLNVTVLNFEGLNGALAKQKICAAAANPPPPANASAINGILTLATALYAVEVAGNYAGGTNLTNLCNQIDPQAISGLGFDGPSVKDFVCSASLGQTTVASCSVGRSATAPASPVNGNASLHYSGTAPASAVNATTSLHSTVTLRSTITLRSVITLRPSGTAPANGINTSSGPLPVVGTGPGVTHGPVTIPTEAPQPTSGSGTTNTTNSTKLLHHYSAKPYSRRGPY